MENVNNLLKSAWIRQLKEEWKSANYYYFNSSMYLPNLEISDSEGTLGTWRGSCHRKLSISINLIKNYRWEHVQDVLYHEMAHQYVDEVLGIRDDLPHGEAFKRICRENGIDPAATGDVQSWLAQRKNRTTLCPENHKLLEKVHKLLALAESPNEHEAQNAMAKAHELLLRHNLSLLDVHTKWNYIHKQVGEVERTNPIKSIISAILCKFFFVEAIWTYGYDQQRNRSGRILEIYGTPENVEMAEYVYDYLQNISELLWEEHKRQKRLTGNRHRRTFIYGLLNGFYHKLDNRISENLTGHLVWKGDPRLKDFFHRRNPKLVRSSSRYSRSCQDTYNSGISQGKNLVIHKGINEKGNREVKLLT
ncbi:MAG: SprT-like domain-containing protein [Candidatus Scalindua sp.]|nr:SprT-like domain-containing protein [Candidatus Scalindua sp.]